MFWCVDIIIYLVFECEVKIYYLSLDRTYSLGATEVVHQESGLLGITVESVLL